MACYDTGRRDRGLPPRAGAAPQGAPRGRGTRHGAALRATGPVRSLAPATPGSPRVRR